MEYRYQKGPGCGGWLLLLGLFALLTGGTPFFVNIVGVLFAMGLFFVFAIGAVLWAITYFIKRQVRNYEQSQTEVHNTFVFLLVNILVKIAQVDGVISQEEIATIRRFFRDHLHYSQSQLLWLKELIKEAIRAPHTLEELLRSFREKFAYEPRLLLLQLIYQVIYSKARVSAQELAVAQNIADFLGISPYDHRAIQGRYGRAAGDEGRYYEILGVEPGADFETIKSAYRKLSMQYHPDKVAHLGEEFRQVAEEKMKELNEAYDYLKKKHQATA